MKKLTKIIFALILSTFMALSLTACAEVENGSKIQRMVIELEYLDASGSVVDTQSAEVKLYLNFAPKTTEHFMKLASDGYYNGVTISHVNNTWCEFGGYTRSNGNELSKKQYGYDNLEGEFKNNGVGGTKLSVKKGALVMKRNYDVTDGTDNSPKYDTAQSTVMVMFNSTDKFDVNNYCVFGMFELSDGEDYDSSKEDLDRSKLTSIGKFESISALQEGGDDKVKTYYFEKSASITAESEYANINSQYYTVTTDGEGDKHYYKGTSITSENELFDEDLTLLQELLSEKANDFLTIPYTEVRIKSISKK